MSRTPLLRAVVRSLRTARLAAAAGVPFDEAVEMRRGALTRREALRASAAAAGAALLAGCASTGPAEVETHSRVRVAVVGAGVAGLHCAWRLKRLGVRAEVYEGSNRPGGRMFSDRSAFPDGQSCELGGELVDTGHKTMQDLAQELGLPLLDFTTDDPSLARWVAHFGGKRLEEKDVLEAFAPIGEAVDAALATLKDPEAGVTYSEPNGGEALDAMSIRQWLDSANAPAGPVRSFLELAYTTEYGLETDDSDALNFLQMISTEEDAFEVFGDSDERFRFKDGNDSVITRLAAALDEGQVHTGERLVAIRSASDGGLVLSFDRGAATHDVAVDHAVLAIPFTMLRKVQIGVDLPPAKRRAIAELALGASAKIMVGFRDRVWRAQGSNGEVFTDLPFQCTWETSRLQPGKSGILTNFTGGRHAAEVGDGTLESRTQEVLQGLDRIFPGAAAAHNGKAVRMHWPSYRWTEGAYSSYRVGQYTAFCGAEIERAGNLHFCGEHTSLDAQGFMEGGALTGAMAADEVAADLGIDAEKAETGAGGAGGRILSRARFARTRGRWLPAAAASLRMRRGRREAAWLACR
jgi:monoamine oxidase